MLKGSTKRVAAGCDDVNVHPCISLSCFPPLGTITKKISTSIFLPVPLAAIARATGHARRNLTLIPSGFPR